MARTSAGTLAPNVPNDARARTGNGTPMRTPALPTMLMRTKITSDPIPIAMTKLMKLPQRRNRLAAR